MVIIDNNYNKNLKNEIYDNTNIKDIEYINEYDNYYLVMDNKYLYLFNNRYEEIIKIDINKMANNKNNYEIIYKNYTIMYMNSYKDKEGIRFKYYDIYTYELVDDILLGGN